MHTYRYLIHNKQNARMLHMNTLILFAFIIPVLAYMAWFALTGNRDAQKFGLLIIVSVLFTYLIASGGEGNTGPLWFYVFPPLLFFLTNLKTGTMSAGVCSIAQVDSIDSMLRQADLQLYSAKAAGRNRIAPRVRSQGTNIQSEPDA